jgi:hypothetical protein
MTVQNTTVKDIYVGNGATTKFPITFQMMDHPEYIKVYITGDDSVAVETENFSVDLGAKTVTYPANGDPLPDGHKITIYRKLPLYQLMNLVNQGPFFAENIELSFDDLTFICQQLNEKLNRTLSTGVDVNNFNNTFLVKAGMSFRINDAGDGLVLTEDPARVLPLAKDVLEQTKQVKESAVNETTSFAESAKKDAEKAEDAADRAEDILLRFESGTITKEFTATDDRWTENNGMWRLTVAMGNSRLIGVYKEVKKPQYEMVLTGVYMDAENVIIEVPEKFAGIVILTSLTKKTGDKVYVKNFTDEDFAEVGSDFVLTISAEEHQAGNSPVIVSLTQIIDGVSYPYYANAGVDNNGNVVINVSKAFTGKIILDGGYLE